jgi:hypothetical protein
VPFRVWDGTIELPIDRAIQNTRSVVYPLHGLDPTTPATEPNPPDAVGDPPHWSRPNEDQAFAGTTPTVDQAAAGGTTLVWTAPLR